MARLDRITTDPAICHGRPTIRGLRHPVQTLLELLASGMTVEEILQDYPAWNVTICSPPWCSARSRRATG